MNSINKKLNIALYGLGILAVFVSVLFVNPEKTYAKLVKMTCNESGCTYLYDEPNSNTNSAVTTSKSSNSSTSKKSEKKETIGTLAATAIFGSDSIVPSGLIQWVLFAIVVMLIVIAVRKLFGSEKRYHSTPLKHD